ncbi:MAG: hypothetical protein LHV68_00040 [Elusimicrobia bacterium]|nr:hypothetical protein [Candidatus Liberimonas magnetica]
MKTLAKLNTKKKKQEPAAMLQAIVSNPVNNPQADRSDPFLYLLNATSNRIKKELYAMFRTPPQILRKCETNCEKMQAIYFSWERSMQEARDGLRKMDTFLYLSPVSPNIQKDVRAFNETINRGREDMGEIKRSLNNKCKGMYRSLDPRGKYKDNLLENIHEVSGSLMKGCREIYNIAKRNHNCMRQACHKVLVEYNKTMHNAPQKLKKNQIHKSFPISPKTYETFIGKCPKW